jgi:hypothetical protein
VTGPAAVRTREVALLWRTSHGIADWGAGPMGTRSRTIVSWQLLQPGGGEQVTGGNGRRVCPYQAH